MASVLSETTGQGNVPASPVETPQPSADNIISAYLSEHIPEHKELVALRIEGWNNPAADTHFESERSSADNPSEKQKDSFYDMTCRIGDELNAFLGRPGNGILSLSFPPRKSIRVLDLCMAPGGFSTAVLNHNPHHDVSIYGVTLPISMGGYEIRIPNWRTDPRIASIQFHDVTMLASEMGITSPDDIPASHPDKASFITTPLFEHKPDKFDLIFCGGTVVRNHSQTFQSYRKHGRRSEGTRLLTAQLTIAMNHIRQGGTMVVVLHRADTWPNAALFHRLSKFSDASKMRLFKPKKAHGKKGSFYLVVRGVDPEREEAREAVEFWKGEWKIASLLTGVDFETDQAGRKDDVVDFSDMETGNDGSVAGAIKRQEDVEAAKLVLAEFGARLVQLTRPVFKIQANELRKAPWAGAANRAGWRV